MIVIDPTKIDALREMIDSDVAERAIESESSRDIALLEYAAEELDLKISICQDWSGWLIAHAIEGSADYAFHDPIYRVATGYLLPDEAAKWLLSSTLIGKDAETLAIASIVRVLSPEADISMDRCTLMRTYGLFAIREIIDAIAYECHHDDRHQLRLSFMEYPTLNDRLRLARNDVAHAMRPQICAWAKFEFDVVIK